MKTLFRESFWQDVRKKVKDKKTIVAIDQAIESIVAATSLSEIDNVKKMKGADNAFRLRVGRFRIGFFLEGDNVEFARCLPRKDIYRYFP